MPSRQVRADVYPAVITLTNSDGTETVYEKARVVLTLDHLYVFQDNHPAPKLVFDDRLTSYSPPTPATRVRHASQLSDRRAQLETEDGFTGAFTRMSGCGCGSRLKNMPLNSLLPGDGQTSAASTKDA